MSSVNTGRILGRLERLIDFRVGERASERHPIILREEGGPATDGTQIFMPRKAGHFASERDNEMFLAYGLAHESDHIREIDEYFKEEAAGLREKKTNLVAEFCQRNYAELSENPALAGEIDNIVKDRRIDAQRAEQLPGVKKYQEEVLNPAAEYFRPSIKGMSKLDSFREHYLQKALIGRVVDPIPEEHRNILEEIVAITAAAGSIQEDPDAVKKIYQIFKNNFDITQPISKLPAVFGRGNHPQQGSGSSEKGYGNEIKPRQGREEKGGERPKNLDKGEEKPCKQEENKGKKTGGKNNDNNNKSGANKPDKNQNEEAGKNRGDSSDLYEHAQEKHGIETYVMETKSSAELAQKERHFREKYAGEIERMKRVFKQLQLRHYGEKRDFQGQELDYESHMQSELEFRVTGIRGNGRHFKTETRNEQKPVFGIHADASGSTKGEIIEGIRAAFYIVGNALSASGWNYGLYASADRLAVLKSPSKKWSDDVNYNIMGLNSGGEGIYLASTSSVISADLKRVEGSPKCLIVISDFEACGQKSAEIGAAKMLMDQKIYPFYIAIGEEHEDNAKSMTDEIGDGHYSVISLDRLQELPNEMFRLFKLFGISR